MLKASRLTAAVAAVVLLCGTPAHAERTWRRLVTPNFEVIGDVGEGQLRSTARELEQFCEAFKQAFPEARITPPAPTTVVVFSSRRAFEPFAPTYEGKVREIGGSFQTTGDRAFILLNDVPRQHAYPLVFHELTHLVESNTRAESPVWFSEGLAEYYSTFRLEGRHAMLGYADVDNLRTLQSNWLPFETLLTVDQTSPYYNERHRASVFYAQSWALVHYLLSDTVRSRQMVDLLDRLATGTPPHEAVRAALGMDVKKLNDEVRRYVFKRAYSAWKVTLAEKIEIDRQPVAVMSDAAVASRRGAIFQAYGRTEAARGEWTRALSLDPDHVEAHVGMGVLEAAAGRADAARQSFTRAAALGPDDYLAQYHYGSWLVENLGPGDIDLAVRALARAAELRPDSPECQYRLSYALLRQGRLDEAEAAARRAMTLLPGASHYRFALVEVRRAQRRYAEARSLLGPLMARGRPSVRQSARELMVRVSDEERRMAERAARAAAGAVSGTDASSLPAAAAGRPGSEGASGDGVIPIYRSTLQGEERDEGSWVGLDCAGNTIVVHVRVGDEVRTYRGTWDEVEFSSHRDDRQGDITCGPRAEPEAVYVTWRPGTGGTRNLVAVEILPL